MVLSHPLHKVENNQQELRLMSAPGRTMKPLEINHSKKKQRRTIFSTRLKSIFTEYKMHVMGSQNIICDSRPGLLLT